MICEVADTQGCVALPLKPGNSYGAFRNKKKRSKLNGKTSFKNKISIL
jgi:hypothetical protein